MKAKKIFCISILIFNGSLCFSQIVPNVNISTMSKTVDLVYRPVVGRDPLIPSTVYQSQAANKKSTLSNQSEKVNISTASATTADYTLIGIVQFSNKKEALLKDSYGNIYFVRDGNIYDNKKNIVKGAKAYIKGKQLTINITGKPPLELFIKGGE